MDLPIRPRQSDEWIVNDGSQPVPDGTLVDLVLCGDFEEPVFAATADHWQWTAGVTKITHWRRQEVFEAV